MKNLLYILLLPLAFASCNRHISSDIVTDVNVKKYTSYAWAEDRDDSKYAIPEQNIRHFTENELAKRGFVYDAENPDVLIRTNFSIEKKQELIREPVRSFAPFGYFGWGMWPGAFGNSFISGYTVRPIQYQEGTIIIDIIDRKKQQHIWRGWSAKALNHKSLKPNKLSKEVERIFKEYPVKAEKM